MNNDFGMLTLPQFVEQNHITARASKIDHPQAVDWSDPWNITASHWRVTLTLRNDAERRQMTVLFHMGSAHKTPPGAVDVLSSLISDALSADRSFEDWCSELGEDSDSRKAFKTWQTVRRQTKRLRQFLGESCFDTATRDVEPY